MLVVEFRVDAPILQAALDRDRSATVTNEELYQEGEAIKYLFWVESDDFEAFEDALAADSTVTNLKTLAETRTRRLYRVTFTEEGEERTTFPVWSELDIVVLDATATHGGGEVRMRVPDREALAAFRETCRKRGFSFHLESVHRLTEESSTADARLSALQREALVTALESGYFEIPRRASLSDVADRLDISSQSLSERIRRGVAVLVETNLPTDDINP